MLHIEQSSPSRYFIETGRNYLLVIISPYLKTDTVRYFVLEPAVGCFIM